MGDLTLWGNDAADWAVWAEMSTEPESADDVARVKKIFNDLGWTQTAGD